ncbi:MAG: AMP-dependent synthetase/ligase, partial [Actinomycetota bacterium]|nr:AMP-dependent synthetase/ligase [Actinomycetota bacterium]
MIQTLHAANLCEAFQNTAQARPDATALRTAGGSTSISWSSYQERVERIARGLAALGVSRGDTVGLMMTNRPEFSLVDTAALHLGATPFSIYNTSAPEQIAYLFGNAENRVVVCEEQFAPRILDAWGETGLEHVVCIDGDLDGTMSIEALEAGGDPGFDFEAAWRGVTPDDVATLIYTSGTTGPPKGVELTHGNIVAELQAIAAFLSITPDDRSISYLPSAHVADRLLSHYGGIGFGVEITCLDNPAGILGATIDARPTFFGGVPRVWEKLMAGLQAAGVADPGALDDVARRATLEKIGMDQVTSAVCGAAPVPTEVLEYFLAFGIKVQEVWGMSELTGVATINPSDDLRIGTVGVAVPGTEVKLADDGELLCRGPIVMRGYRNQPEKTAETIDADGWLATGDIAEIDADGYVKIVDRKKELIINAAGKNMSPANIESHLKAASPLIGQAAAIGNAR